MPRIVIDVDAVDRTPAAPNVTVERPSTDPSLAPNRRMPHRLAVQIIVPMTCQPKDYVEGELHRTVCAPKTCPLCQTERKLESLGYYSRGTTDDIGRILSILVRRFQCRDCHRTVSCLPRFAQPYRLVNSNAIDAYFNGRRTGFGIEQNIASLGRYWRRFAEWSAQLRDTLGPSFGPTPPGSPDDFWRLLRVIGPGLGGCTLELVRDHGVTLFGAYLCHRATVRT